MIFVKITANDNCYIVLAIQQYTINIFESYTITCVPNIIIDI